jgi:hypothetical protein
MVISRSEGGNFGSTKIHVPKNYNVTTCFHYPKSRLPRLQNQKLENPKQNNKVV